MKVINYWSLSVYVEIKGIALSQEPEKKILQREYLLKYRSLTNFFVDEINLAQRSISNDLAEILP